MRVGGRQDKAHREVYRQTRGEIPEGRQINHLCNRPYCVQPSHLYAGDVQDNRDDSRIFNEPNLMHAPWVIQWPSSGTQADRLLQRLREVNRYENVEPWEPIEHPTQTPLEEFTCPGHDFAITMFGNRERICRICEATEMKEEWEDALLFEMPQLGPDHLAHP